MTKMVTSLTVATMLTCFCCGQRAAGDLCRLGGAGALSAAGGQGLVSGMAGALPLLVLLT